METTFDIKGAIQELLEQLLNCGNEGRVLLLREKTMVLLEVYKSGLFSSFKLEDEF